ncbi:unnamed protein product [Paramecium octaurelia]|uniref:Uncharacterized protein n=1 Tax=Paramecium octaurelia TaxID=43137 RepID=A0A8S1W4H9_PAROT|nr:unnamed protein product [Paramecium octaurelia]
MCLYERLDRSNLHFYSYQEVIQNWIELINSSQIKQLFMKEVQPKFHKLIYQQLFQYTELKLFERRYQQIQLSIGQILKEITSFLKARFIQFSQELGHILTFFSWNRGTIKGGSEKV